MTTPGDPLYAPVTAQQNVVPQVQVRRSLIRRFSKGLLNFLSLMFSIQFVYIFLILIFSARNFSDLVQSIEVNAFKIVISGLFFLGSIGKKFF